MTQDQRNLAASIAIYSERHSIEEISQALGLEPTCAARKGEPMSKRRARGPLQPHNAWILEVEAPRASEADLDVAVRELFERLDGARSALAQLRSQGAQASCWLFFSSSCGQACSLVQASTLQLLAAWNLDLVLDVYPPQP